MAVNLINSNDITVTQTGDNIQLETPTHINTIVSNIGDLTNLNTTNKSNIVEAINEINGEIPDIYSTNEVKTNKVWIDNKPIYRKIVTGTLPATNFSTFITIDNLDTPISENILITTADNSKLRLPFVNLINNVYCDYYISGNNYYVHFSVNTYGNRPFIAILEYTKTTD